MFEIPEKWNKKTYQEYLNNLKNIAEEKYKNFHKKLCFTKYEILGIRVPVLKKIASKILKTDYKSFFNYCKTTCYEEVFIEGLILSSLTDEETFELYFFKYITKIDNWAICDTFCNNLKIVTQNEKKYFNICKELSLSNEEYISRIGLVTILNFFVKENYLEDIFKILNSIQSEKYYINMAQAWLICELYIKYPKFTENFLKENNLNKFTQNKAISKIRDSYRISTEEKEYLNTLKKK